MQRSHTIIFAGACIALSSTACGSDSTSPVADLSSDAGVDPSAECPANTPTFADGPNGLQAPIDTKNGIAVRLIQAQFSPPAKMSNDWTIAVTDPAGAPTTNAQITWACAWMPVHGHGSNPTAIDNLGNGQFKLEKQNLSMYGGWEIQLWVNNTGAGTQYAPQNGGGSLLTGNACTPDPSSGATGSPNIMFNICVPQAR